MNHMFFHQIIIYAILFHNSRTRFTTNAMGQSCGRNSSETETNFIQRDDMEQESSYVPDRGILRGDIETEDGDNRFEFEKEEEEDDDDDALNEDGEIEDDDEEYEYEYEDNENLVNKSVRILEGNKDGSDDDDATATTATSSPARSTQSSSPSQSPRISSSLSTWKRTASVALSVPSKEEQPPLIEAQKLVDKFTNYFHSKIMAKTDEINIVWEHNIMFLAASFVETYRQFKKNGLPHQVILAYHYTDSENLNSIELNGLLSKPEREEAKVSCVKFSGEAYGPGIYTCHDPINTARYGNQGIMMAILRGVTGLRGGRGVNTVVNGNPEDKMGSWSILKTAEQVLPLVLIPRDSFVGEYGGSEENVSMLYEFHCGVQKVFDEFFNQSEPAVVSRDLFVFSSQKGRY